MFKTKYTLATNSLMLLSFVLIIFNCFLSVSIYFHKKIEQAAILSHDRNTTLHVSRHVWENSNSIQQVEKNEICYFGKMFDIKHIEFTQDSVIVVGHFDRKENCMIDAIYAGLTMSSATSQSMMFNFFQAIKPYSFEHPICLIQARTYIQRIDERLVEHYLAIDIPPPRYI